MIKIAAVGDLHIGPESANAWQRRLARVNEDAEVLLLAGDLTRHGSRDEADALAVALEGVAIPVFAVLGNHDFHDGNERAVIRAIEKRGGRVLEGDAAVVDTGSQRVGIAGTKGFGGGFLGACATAFGEPEMKAFIGHTRVLADRLREALEGLDTQLRIALLHYAPIPETLLGEKREIYPFLGSYLLAEAVDTAGADLILHGHAHAGSERGATAAGICVRNVAEPVIRSAYRVFCMPGMECAEQSTHHVTPPT